MNNKAIVTRIPLKRDVNLDPVAENVYPLSDGQAGNTLADSQLIQNTGYHFENGVSSVHQVAVTNGNSPAYSYLTEGGNLIELRPNGNDSVGGYPINAVYLDGKFLDNVPSHGVESVTPFYGQYCDFLLTDGNPIGLTISSMGSTTLTLKMDEVDISSGSIVNTRSFTISGLSGPWAYTPQLVRQCLGRSFTWSSTQYVFFKDRVYDDSGAATWSLPITTPIVSSLWCCKFWNQNDWFIQIQGNNTSITDSSVFVKANNAVPANNIQLRFSFALMQCKNGFNRVLATGCTPNSTVANDYCVMYGYTQFSAAYVNTLTRNTTTATGANTNKIPTAGYAYCDVSHTDNNLYCTAYYNPDITIGTLESRYLFTSYSNIPVYPTAGYGRLSYAATSDYGSKPPFEFRISIIPSADGNTSTGKGGSQQLLSVASTYYISGSNSQNLGSIGAPISTFGEIDVSFAPQISSDWSSLLWRWDGVYYLCKISTTPIRPIQKISTNLYKINSISPINVVNVNGSILTLGSNDYHGGLRLQAATAGATVNWVNSVIQWSNTQNVSAQSIDFGGNAGYYWTAGNMDAYPIGAYSPSCQTGQYYNIVQFTGSGISANSFYSAFNQSGVYVYKPYGGQLQKAYSYQAIGAGTTYISNTSLVPVPLGARYQGSTIGTNSVATSSAFRETYVTSGYQGVVLTSEWDGYIIGNQISANSIGFTLFSQPYLFDGKNIFKITINNGGIQVPITPLVRADGLIFLTTSFEEAFFYSPFDNSIWSFNGGYTLNKRKRLDGMGAIQNASFNSFTNSLLVITSSWLANYVDGVWTAIPRSALMVPDASESTMRIYDTTSGNIFGNSTAWWYYKYFQRVAPNTATSNGITTTETVYPFNYQTSYIGPDENKKMVLSAITFSVYNESKAALTMKAVVSGYDQENTFTSVTKNFSIVPANYGGGGYVQVLRVQPEKQRFMAASILLSCSTDVRIYDLHYHWTEDSQAIPSAARSQ